MEWNPTATLIAGISATVMVTETIHDHGFYGYWIGLGVLLFMAGFQVFRSMR